MLIIKAGQQGAISNPKRKTPGFLCECENIADLEILYIGGASNLTYQEFFDRYTWDPRMGPFPRGFITSEAKFYTGIHGGHNEGYYGIRENHPRDTTSKLRDASIIANPPKSMWQIMFRMCDSRTTKELAESFIMVCICIFSKYNKCSLIMGPFPYYNFKYKYNLL